MNAGRLTHEECKEDIYKVHDIVRRIKEGRAYVQKSVIGKRLV